MASGAPTRRRTGQESVETVRRTWVRPTGPWFQERHQLAALVAALLYAAGWIEGLIWVSERDAATAFFALPVALLAVTFGRRGGVGAGITAAAAVVLWGAASGDFREGAAWAVVVALTALGVLLGEAVEDLMASERAARTAEANQFRAEQAARKLAEAAEVNDKIVQSIAVAKWALESGETERAIEMIDQAVSSGQLIVSSLLREADAALYGSVDSPDPIIDVAPVHAEPTARTTREQVTTEPR